MADITETLRDTSGPNSGLCYNAAGVIMVQRELLAEALLRLDLALEWIPDRGQGGIFKDETRQWRYSLISQIGQHPKSPLTHPHSEEVFLPT
jgi:hypothetical protein